MASDRKFNSDESSRRGSYEHSTPKDTNFNPSPDPDLTRTPGYLETKTRTYPASQRTSLEDLDRSEIQTKKNRGQELSPNQRVRQGFRAVRKDQTKALLGLIGNKDQD